MRFFIFIILAVGVLFSKEFTLYAPNMHTENGKIIANDGVVLFSHDYFARAKSLEYDEINSTLVLKGNVFINNNDSYTNTQEAFINTQDKTIIFKDFFIGNSEFEIWLRSKNAKYKDNKVLLYDSYVSSCEVDRPTWKIGFKEGEFDTNTKDLSLKHSLFYYKDTPIFYMPFFSVNVENARRSGLLVPDIGIKTRDGFYYRQPIYIAPTRYMDFQFDPIIRTNRGYGIFNLFRFAGPNGIKLELGGGSFKDSEKYIQKNNPQNTRHNGIELYYHQDNLFFEDNFQEGVYFKGAYVNDVDYVNLVSSDLKLDGNFVNSKFNYFVGDDRNFYGFFARYYIDTSKESNVTTIQELPHLNYHRFTEGFFDDIFQYNLNLDMKNFYRKELSKATLYKANLPISINFSLLDNYLDVKLEEKFSGSYANYSASSNNDEYIFANSHSVKLSSNLTEKYDTFYHNISPEISFNVPGILKGGFTEDFLYNHNEEKSIDFSFTQFFYNLKKEKKFEHFVKFKYLNDEKAFGILNNKATYYFNSSTYIKDEIDYDLKYSKLQKHFINFGIDIDGIFKTSFGYFYSNIKDLKEPVNKNLVHDLSYIYNNRYKFFYSLGYDLRSNMFNEYYLGLTYRKKCINYTLAYKQTIEPVLSKNEKSLKQQGVYFLINLYPLGGVVYDYSLR